MRPAAAAAAAFAALDVSIALGMLVLALVPLRAGVPNPIPSVLVVPFVTAFFIITPALGGLVAARQPRNPIGWLFLAMSFWFAFGMLTDMVARHLDPSPALGLFATLGSDLGALWIAAFFLVLVLFPTGTLPGRRWRVLPVTIAVATALMLGAGLFASNGGIEPSIPGLPLPLARPDLQRVVDVVGGAGNTLYLATLVGAVALLAVRFRRSRGVERQQLKWFVWATSIVAGILLFTETLGQLNDAVGNAGWVVFLASLVLLPTAAATAVLRYRLFEIDVLINRTIVYAALSAILALVYAGSVLVLTQLVAPVTRTSSFAVAASTLLVAAAFQPARRRVQTGVDRRFYRHRYDATLEVGRFAAGLRGEVDVERVERRLVSAVERTMEPAFAAVWLRADAAAAAVGEEARE